MSLGSSHCLCRLQLTRGESLTLSWGQFLGCYVKNWADVCPNSSPVRLRVTTGVYGGCGLCARMQSVHQSVCTSTGGDGETGRERWGGRAWFPAGISLWAVRAAGCRKICGTPLHTCDCLLSVRSKRGNTNELAITSETNPDNAVRDRWRNPPKKQEQSLQGQPVSKCSNSDRRGNLCLRLHCGAGFKGMFPITESG